MIELIDVQVMIDDVVKLGPIALTIASGEHLALCGPSGAGKSLLVECVAGVRYPEAGTLRFEGKDVTRLGAWERHCGWVPQSRALFPHMTVYDNIAFGLKGRSDTKERVATLARELAITSLLERSPLTLSGGERSRVALARALAPEPKYLVLDEPFTALDKGNRDRAWELVYAAQSYRKLTILHVTHDEERATKDGLRVVRISEGKIVAT